ncbi:MAG: hypothetical protein A2626_02945 [Candidatus Nealsonbacteria bacterium RIFCSPHIGHO2_01_FULL_38_55]|uniref:DUF11 domain-containing protein n=1 Tax=Candidatus Nealsonbacteria bacterium RIFCSPHIGHO2_01_FULL_38_55 TaxID=1801664 RepID=A0A1G2E1F9_9BACT|nr:MAG: hypothetical protein A2626_02945 [Candidatus Nealsonbacteria bacterium RIFCSPHIGHO2_01_FULL_38_55]OGZ23150.1 MAG: hypothetical protein A3E18_02550 [Candidatus Nealsonbacteria bacterium RIFCSPHIGHO2_12_FULL_38_18]OGZ23741.1 MAG: hypothetical protein A2981_00820 [Candidatus Nealsonbacteria bacterium RIFCSPLOWO2_01_FULL_38_120]OGZ25085.1 MAG: hypothetical protein A3I85_02580 [Candidatus Nealsonbacteria bacterium RIFCSPLOWO2_02_FULL_38_63]
MIYMQTQNKTKNSTIKKSIFAILFLTGIMAPVLIFACSSPININTLSASNITQTSATLKGQITLCGILEKATVWFQYGTTTSYGQVTSEQKNYPQYGPFTADISGLTPCANYHFRAVAKDDNGIIYYGQDMAFATKCNIVSPTVDIKANSSDGPVSIAYNSPASLSWTSTNATSCQAYGNWSGIKATSGSESTGNLTFSKVYTISCAGQGGIATDNVSVNVTQNMPPIANAGQDKEVAELASVVLEGSGTDPDNDLITYSWSCGGGTLSNPNISQPTFNAPSVFVDMNYVCILTVSDPYGLSDFDSMNVKIKDQTPVPILPTVDIKVNGYDGAINVAYNSLVNLSWTSTNANSCYASGGWSGTKATSGNESAGNAVLSRTYMIICSGDGGSASDSVIVNVTPVPQGNLTIEKLVRNTSDGTAWLDSVSADPGEMLSFSIKITADSSAVQDVILKDALPNRIIFRDNLKIDGVYQSSDLIAGLNLGTFNSYQSKTITFDAEVANKNMFSVGDTQLINTALVYSTSSSSSDTAKVVVKKESPTDISTGLTNNIFFDSFFLPLVIALSLVWLFRARIIRFEEWLDMRNKIYRQFKAKKILQFRCAKIKAQEYIGKLGFKRG